MRKFFTSFFIVMGVIFTAIILIGICFMVFSSVTGRAAYVPNFGNPSPESNSSETPDGLSNGQADALRSFGIDPSVVNNITPEQEECFVASLGESRVAEIKAGATPTAGDFFKAKSCL